MSEVTLRFEHQTGPTPDDVSRTPDGRELRTAEDVMVFVAELEHEAS